MYSYIYIYIIVLDFPSPFFSLFVWEVLREGVPVVTYRDLTPNLRVSLSLVVVVEGVLMDLEIISVGWT